MLRKRTLVIALSVLCFCALAFSSVLSKPAKASDVCPSDPYEWFIAPYGFHVWGANAPNCTTCKLFGYNEATYVDTGTCTNGYCNEYWAGGPGYYKVECDTTITNCWMGAGK